MQTMNQALADATTIDQKLSKRHIDLDPGGYVIIYLDREQGLICAKHFTNFIDERGLRSLRAERRRSFVYSFLSRQNPAPLHYLTTPLTWGESFNGRRQRY